MLTIGDRDFQRVVLFVRERYGINLSKKRALVQGRLAFYIERQGYVSFADYLDDVVSRPDGAEAQRMIDRLSTNHTFFFREPEALEHMRSKAVPALARQGARQIDIWCAASSTGQECYSIAMMLEEALALEKGVSYRILGSDINTEVLEKARAGVYPNEELEHIPQRFRTRYCHPCGDGRFQIADALKEHIAWKQINLIGSLRPIPPQHLIFCRNVMIYFEPETKEALTSELYRLVRGGGFVYVGNTETLDMKRTRFRYLEPSVFEKKGAEG